MTRRTSAALARILGPDQIVLVLDQESLGVRLAEGGNLGPALVLGLDLHPEQRSFRWKEYMVAKR